ncbi:hypothetical protein HPQ64_08655 [Rhizobiales bacterium]|uniref:hypothetical protein n=1 Tax=Hongsoonwoonella zoysiae TaxID=2821844 RepID=UPI001560680E|nr:hypothetical protein [Hongsoonwoonella zoysiae]NRG17757.1 hypothetical protein [Hongsoonwoonella zoysiae]
MTTTLKVLACSIPFLLSPAVSHAHGSGVHFHSHDILLAISSVAVIISLLAIRKLR